ncbi:MULTISPECIES: IdeS/Mac family cysteine endopeptidase [unclassified Treponema]|uniref:IdeS/Mac family cysteine endopeptidase n=1 Tax=unclassified Treponema TaxID=2638727 RepID=UPI0020A2C688|nr:MULTISPECIES: IdeS/Mac family cysteine endopeptidase [unclassified Treponema]UTC66723.1 hypothetical protein E4O06_12305 [Treponema sp. OMZ 789]UTC69455.1 hypothetical protein E4O01_12445 [Treponema sp. OMZ 790]UTC72169.1 hypothetical protein E4O02_12540 [Treponema sp. OMZ 791]
MKQYTKKHISGVRLFLNLFGVSALISVLALGCSAPIKPEPLKVRHAVQFGVEGGGGQLQAAIDGKSIASGAKAENGTTAVFTAQPREGYVVAGWNVTGGVIVSGRNEGDLTAAVKLTSDTSVKVSFKQRPASGQPPVSSGQGTVPVSNITFKGKDTQDGTEFAITYSMNLELNKPYRLIPVFDPPDASDKNLQYEVKKGDISVSPEGIITVNGIGSAEIAARASNGREYTMYFNIKDDYTFTVEGKKEIKHSRDAFTETLVIEKKYNSTKYVLTVNPPEPWLTVEKSGENTKKETLTLRIAENKAPVPRMVSLTVSKIESARRGKQQQKKAVHTLNITQTPNLVDPKLITKWVHGITPPAEGEIKTETGTDVRYRKWEETAHTTWFNARKLRYTQNYRSVTDANMCWAMSTSDLLHWWMRENKDNLERYMRKKGITSGKAEYLYYTGEYKGGLGDIGEKDKSSIANVFRQGYADIGLQLHTAVNWYLRGASNGLQKIPPPGIVQDVFTGQEDLNKLIEVRYAHNKKEFEDMINGALNDGHAIAVVIKPKTNIIDPLHVVTVWGVVFDEDDNIVELWTSDSNDRNSHIVKFGVYYPDGIPHKINYAAPNDKGDTRIEEVAVMKSAKKEFKAWLDAGN